MNRVILAFLFVGLAASASLSDDDKQARALLTSYYNVYKELVKDKDFPNNFDRNDLLARLEKADSTAHEAMLSQLSKRSNETPMQALEQAFRAMAEEKGFSEDQLRPLANKMIAEGKFPDLRNQQKSN